MPAAPIAPFTPLQNVGFGETLGAQGMAQPYFGAAANYLQGSAAPVTGQDVSQYYNPMANQVMSQMQNIFGNQMRTLTGDVTQQAGGVGADRIGVAQSNLANQQGLAAGQTLANLYYPALQAAQQQRQMMAGAGFGLGQLGPAAQTSQLQGIQALLGAGGQQQGLAQAMMNAQYQQQLGQIAYPFQTAQYLAGITGGLAPAMGGTTTGQAQTTQTPAQPSGLAQALGLGTAGIGTLGSLGSAMPGTGTGKGSMPQSNYFSPYMGMSPYPGTSGSAVYNRGGGVEGFQGGGPTGSGAPFVGPAATGPIGQSATTAANVIAPSAEEQAQLNAIYGTIPNLNALPAGASTYANQFANIPQLPGLTPLQTTGLGPNTFASPSPSPFQTGDSGSRFWHMSPEQFTQMFAANPQSEGFQQGGTTGLQPAPGMSLWSLPTGGGGLSTSIPYQIPQQSRGYQAGGGTDPPAGDPSDPSEGDHIYQIGKDPPIFPIDPNIDNPFTGGLKLMAEPPAEVMRAGYGHLRKALGYQAGGDTGDDSSSIPGVSIQSPSGAGIPGASPPKVGGLTPIPTGKLQPGPGKSGLYGQYLSPFGAHQQTAGGSQSTPASEAMQGMQLASSLAKLPGMFGGSGAGAAGAGMPLDLSAAGAGAGAGDVGAATAAGKGATAGLEEAAPLLLAAQRGGAIDDYSTIGPGAPEEQIPLPRPRPDVPVEFYPKGPYVHDFLKGVGGSPDWRQDQRQIASGGAIEGYQDAGAIPDWIPPTLLPPGLRPDPSLPEGTPTDQPDPVAGAPLPRERPVTDIPESPPRPQGRPVQTVPIAPNVPPFGQRFTGQVGTGHYPLHPLDPTDPDYSPQLDPHNPNYNPNDPRLVFADPGGRGDPNAPGAGGGPRGPYLPGSASAPGATPPSYSPSPFGSQPDYGPATPYQAQRGMNFAQRMAASPWFPLIGAGAAMATTATPGQRGFGAFGSVLGTGLGAYAKGVEGQRKSLDTEDAQNQKAQRLEEMAAYHMAEIQRQTRRDEDVAEANKQRREAQIEAAQAKAAGKPPDAQHYYDQVYKEASDVTSPWYKKPPEELKAEARRRYLEAQELQREMTQPGATVKPPMAPATPATPTTPPAAPGPRDKLTPGPAPPTSQAPPEPGAKFYNGKWYRRGPNGEAIPVETAT
jgi:hypothetical protein